MSECVVRMKMPQNCFNCSTKINPEERQCNIDGHIFEETLDKLLYGRDMNCPVLMALPEGHGRLVDKDEMLKKIENYHRYMTVGRESDPRCIIEDSPTIVPAERS